MVSIASDLCKSCTNHFCGARIHKMHLIHLTVPCKSYSWTKASSRDIPDSAIAKADDLVLLTADS